MAPRTGTGARSSRFARTRAASSRFFGVKVSLAHVRDARSDVTYSSAAFDVEVSVRTHSLLAAFRIVLPLARVTVTYLNTWG